MGTEISLDIGGMSIAWAKNHRGADHGFLFQPGDRQSFAPDQLDSEGVEEDDPDWAAGQVGFARPLRTTVPRLELLGYTLAAAETEYRRAAAGSLEEHEAYREYTGDTDAAAPELMSFEEFRAFLTDTSITDLDDTFVGGGEYEEQRVMGRFVDEAFKARLPYYSLNGANAWSERSYFQSLIEFLHPYTLLRLLAENSSNLEAQLEWEYGPLVANGWAEENEFNPGARRRQTYLIATEGSSDTHILKRAFKLLRPEIADFFRFIDVSERHPFSGTGSLVKFAEGLAKIDLHNRTLFLLDNDAEGVSAFQRIRAMALPVNMRALTLPALDAFKQFRTVGPDGESIADINGRAAAMECYLDLEAEGVPPPIVRWTNFKDDMADYQGVLERKDRYNRAFLAQAGRGKPYDTAKLSAVLADVVNICTSMATDMLKQNED